MSEPTLELPREGEKIGSGLVIGVINAGGSARVYKTLVADLELNRAVKVMSPDAPQDVRDRFPTEARITSKLIHQNIVQVFNFGLTNSGLPYIEMEYINGLTLDTLLRQRGALPLPVALAVAIGILEAVHYAHTVQYTLYEKQHRGVLHRDIKPSNIIFSGNIPKLTDFGIARPPGVSLHTLQGDVPGTVPYMAPETCTSGETDFRTDIYQVGLVMYECISGQIAYPQGEIEPLVNAIKAGTRKPLNTHPKAAAIVKKCLELDPDKRYKSAQACLAEVRALYHTQNPGTTPEAQIAAFLDDTTPVYIKPTTRDRDKTKILKFAAAILVLYFFIMATITFGPRIVHATILYVTTAAQQAQQTQPHAADIPTLDTRDTSDTSNTRDTQAPAATAAPTVAPRPKQARTKTRTDSQGDRVGDPAPTVPPTPPQEDALRILGEGQALLKDNKPQAALIKFQLAIKTPSTSLARSEVINQSLYGTAKCNSLLYEQGKASRSAHDAAWRVVKNTFPAGSPEHAEAVSQLNTGADQ